MKLVYLGEIIQGQLVQVFAGFFQSLKNGLFNISMRVVSFDPMHSASPYLSLKISHCN